MSSRIKKCFLTCPVYLKVSVANGEHLPLLEHDRLVHHLRVAQTEGTARRTECVRNTCRMGRKTDKSSFEKNYSKISFSLENIVITQYYIDVKNSLSCNFRFYLSNYDAQ